MITRHLDQPWCLLIEFYNAQISKKGHFILIAINIIRATSKGWWAKRLFSIFIKTTGGVSQTSEFQHATNGQIRKPNFCRWLLSLYKIWYFVTYSILIQDMEFFRLYSIQTFQNGGRSCHMKLLWSEKVVWWLICPSYKK